MFDRIAKWLIFVFWGVKIKQKQFNKRANYVFTYTECAREKNVFKEMSSHEVRVFVKMYTRVHDGSRCKFVITISYQRKFLVINACTMAS